jgi:glycosyltransferase involved in cell wall biosynthesis
MDTRDLDAREGTLRNRLRRWFFRAAHWLANRFADGQTAITMRMAELVGIPDSQLWGIWPSGVQLDQFTAAQDGRRWPKDGEPIQLIYIGKMRVGCNLLALCQAVERANLDGMVFVLSLIGEGPERSELEEIAQGAAGRICVRPAIPHDQIPQMLRQVHVGVTALFSPDDRLFAASSPIKLFEYMAAGLPILSTRSACHTEVVGAGTYAFWAESPSQEEILGALRAVWRARAELSEKGRQAAASARNWTWEAAGSKLSAALEYGLMQSGVRDHGRVSTVD